MFYNKKTAHCRIYSGKDVMKKLSCYVYFKIIILFAFLLTGIFNCTNGGSRSNSSKKVDIIPPNSNEDLSSIPLVKLPYGYDISNLTIMESDLPVPKTINSYFSPIGKIYDIRLAGNKSTDFGNEYAELIFSYDNIGLGNKGFIEEFMVFYYDDVNGKWNPVDRIEEDIEDSVLTAFTSHLTPST